MNFLNLHGINNGQKAYPRVISWFVRGNKSSNYNTTDTFTKTADKLTSDKNENKEITVKEMKDAFKKANKLPYNESNNIKNTKLYKLFEELEFTEILEILNKKHNGEMGLKETLSDGSILFFNAQADFEYFSLMSKHTSHHLQIYNNNHEFRVQRTEDKNYKFSPGKNVNELNYKEAEVLKNGFNYFKTFKNKTPQAESSNYESLGKLIPKHKGMIYEKVKLPDGTIKKVPIKVDIEKENGYTFNFVKDGKKIGYLELEFKERKILNKKDPLEANYRQQKIKGDRIIVSFLNNLEENKYGGMGHLADLIEVACCKELKIKPNIISYSLPESCPKHYLRGKRFIPFRLYAKELDTTYNKSSADDIVKKSIEVSKNKDKFNTEMICNMFLMYMPQNIVKELEEELKLNPIF